MSRHSFTFPTARQLRATCTSLVNEAVAKGWVKPIDSEPVGLTRVVSNAGIKGMNPGRENVYVSETHLKFYVERIQGERVTWYDAGSAPLL